MSDEVWKPIPRYPGYEASSLGRVRSVDREVLGLRHGREAIIKRRGVILRQREGRYLSVTLYGKIPATVHALVCEAFHGERPDGMQAAHNDGRRRNNRADNLRWATASENNQDKRAHGTQQDQRGEKAPGAKLKSADVIDIFASIGSETQASIAKRYGVDQSTISDIKCGKNWAHLQHLRRA